ncbi:MAG TPA: carbohydrate ABC transporter permease [Anaerolineales bacterium]|nr:carbohydrate ABC transporter permease [Anaerolineales bacterium]
MHRSKRLQMILFYPVYLLVTFTILYPLAWMIYSSLKSDTDIFANVFALPKILYLENYITVFVKGGMDVFFRNSLFISITSVTGLLIICSMAAYAFANMHFKGKTALYLFILLGLMIPPQAMIISGFKWISILKLVSSHWALIFTYFGWASFGILVLRSFFQSVPQEIKDAALIDGAGHWQMLTRIMLPLARPSISTIAIFYFMWVWNDFIYPLVYLQDEEKYTVPLGIIFLNGRYTVNWGLQMAGLSVATVPPLLIYLIFQRQFIRGILAGALKG